MEIKNCSLTDTITILKLYDAARHLQSERNMVVWPIFEESFIEREIIDGRQWKLIIGDAIACNWAITFEDREIWGERDNNNSVYIHRIATNPHFRGNGFINDIVTWGKTFGLAKMKQYLRLDTLGNNTRLIEHYKEAGFTFLGITRLTETRNLPEHYQREPNCCRFELPLF